MLDASLNSVGQLWPTSEVSFRNMERSEGWTGALF